MDKKEKKIYKYVLDELQKTVELVDEVYAEPIPEMVQAKAQLLNVRRSALEGLIKSIKVKSDIELNIKKLENDVDDNINVNIKIIGED